MTSLKLITCVLLWLADGTFAGKVVDLTDQFSLWTSDSEFGLDLVSNQDGVSEVFGSLGLHQKNGIVSVLRDGVIGVAYPDVKLTIDIEENDAGKRLIFTWDAPVDAELIDCLNFRDEQWYGGPQQKRQYWPVQKLKLSRYSYVSKEEDNAAIAEPYWLSSRGYYIYVDKETPLFIDQNVMVQNRICLISNVTAPYSRNRAKNTLKYSWGITGDPRKGHMYAVDKFLGKPKGYPDYRMTQHPIWSTWAEYKIAINESIVMDFANKIIDNGFNNSQLEIDDLWETCYGSFNLDTDKFPDFKAFNLKLKEMGFRVTIWIHPFINKGCEPWYSEAMDKGYLVLNEAGNADTSWWNSVGPTAAYVDFTKDEAVKWWVDRLKNLQEMYAIDSFKFDAGESSWSPQVPVQIGNINTHPTHITTKYVEACSQFGPMVEVRAGQRTQDLPIYVRMIDKDSEWTFENGLPTLITTLLQMNMNGYPLVLPDMIGGNGYNDPPSKELFIRWLQANTFMPSLQYSYVPWDYDEETIRISHKFTDLHADYTDEIMKAFKRAVKDGVPVNPPIWWIDPKNEEAHAIWDEYLLGEDILVAPVLEQGAVSRDIYLPNGTWQGIDKIYEGLQWIKDYPAPLDTLPYFIRLQDKTE